MKPKKPKDIINDFLKGKTIGLQNDKNRDGIQLGIYENALIGIGSKTVIPIAIRLTSRLVVKNVAHGVALIHMPHKYLYNKADGFGIYVTTTAIPKIRKGTFEEQIGKTIEQVSNEVGEQYAQIDPGILNTPQMEYKKIYERKLTVESDMSTIRNLMYFSLKLEPDKINNMIKTVKASHEIMERLEKYLMICITLPEISSPGIERQEETREDMTPASSPSLN